MPYCWLAGLFSVGYSWAGASFLSCLSTLRTDPHQSPSNYLRVYPQQGLCSLCAQKELTQSCTISFMPSSFASIVRPFPHLVNWGWRTAPMVFNYHFHFRKLNHKTATSEIWRKAKGLLGNREIHLQAFLGLRNCATKREFPKHSDLGIWEQQAPSLPLEMDKYVAGE